MTIRYICVDGSDGLGKTTQIKLLREELERRGLKVHSTRLLGGDGKDPFQLALREVLLSDKFPTDEVMLEETLFAMSDLEGLRAAAKFLADNPGGVVLKDRGVASHVAYARSKGMADDDIWSVHSRVLQMERHVAEIFGGCNLIMVPNDVGWVLERIAARSLEDGTPVLERLENEDTQRSVVSAMRHMPSNPLVDGIPFEVIEVEKLDSVEAVQARIVAALSIRGA